MKKALYLFLLFTTYYLLNNVLQAQNLVPNSSFETYINCPRNLGPNGDFNCVMQWFQADYSPDYFNACDTTPNEYGVPNNAAGTQLARTGVAYAGFYTLNLSYPNCGREYIEIKLIDTLSNGKCYKVQFYVSLADEMWYATNTIGAYFSPTQFIDTTDGLYSIPCLSYFNFSPQILNKHSNPLVDKNNWILITDTFTAIGNETYMMIGNFNPDSTSDINYIDSIGWGKYTSYYYIDDVSVMLCSDTTGIKEINEDNSISVYPNPASDNLTIKIGDFRFKNLDLKINDIVGNTVLEKILYNKVSNIDVSALAKGMYFVKIKTNEGMAVKKFIKE